MKLNKEELTGIKYVSVIVPVYQVEHYLEQCLRSIAEQTYRNIEILIIARPEGDGSFAICKEWEKKDDRIRVIEQIGKGLGDARNQGIEEAHGEYLCFIDSDDWLDVHYVEEMVNCLEDNQADLAECEYWECQSDQYIRQSENTFLRKVFDQNTEEVFGAPAAWKIMSRRAVWVKNHLRFPNTPAEDLAVYMLCFSLFKSVVFVSKPLYYYRIREDNLSHTWASSADSFSKMLEVYHHIVEAHKMFGFFYEKRDEILLKIATESRVVNASFKRKFGDEIGQKCLEESWDLVRKHFGNTIYDQAIMLWGSYNLGRIGSFFCLDLPETNRYSFSSLIALMSKRKDFVISHPNSYRKKALQREITREFRKQTVLEKTDYVLVDFLEERFDIIQSGDAFFTKSDAFDESENNIRVDRVIKRDSEECKELFQDACRRFMQEIVEYSQIKMVLIENYLCEQKGRYQDTKEYDDVADIRKMNALLKGYYDFFEEEYPEIPIIRMERQDLNYTDIDFKYGCYPWHMNQYGYIAIGLQLKELIWI